MVIPGLVSSVAGGRGSRPRLPACGRRQAGINGVDDRVVVAIGAVERGLAGDLVLAERHPAVLVRLHRPAPDPGLSIRAGAVPAGAAATAALVFVTVFPSLE